MVYLIQTNIWWLLAALVIGFAVGAWIWARPRHRIALSQPDEDAPLARTLEREAVSPAAPVAAPDTALAGGGPAAADSPFLPGPLGEPDDLRRLKGVGPKLGIMLGELGVYHYHQIASWNDGHVTIVDERLGGFKGRIERDRWREQARLLAEGRFDDFEALFGAGAQGREPGQE